MDSQKRLPGNKSKSLEWRIIKDRILTISDIHGCYDEFKELLNLVDYDSNQDQLILLGDYMDRGRNSKEVIYFVKELVEEHGVIALKGNHDKMFCDWLDDPIGQRERYFRNGASETIQSFLRKIEIEFAEDHTYQEWAAEILESHEELIHFLKNLPYYYETEQFIFVHAGINPANEDWKMTSKHDFVWIRDPFLKGDHAFHKTFVHGHTPTTYLHGKADIYYGAKKIGIDGGCVYGHQLNCLEIKNGELKESFVNSSLQLLK